MVVKLNQCCRDSVSEPSDTVVQHEGWFYSFRPTCSTSTHLHTLCWCCFYLLLIHTFMFSGRTVDSCLTIYTCVSPLTERIKLTQHSCDPVNEPSWIVLPSESLAATVEGALQTVCRQNNTEVSVKIPDKHFIQTVSVSSGPYKLHSCIQSIQESFHSNRKHPSWRSKNNQSQHSLFFIVWQFFSKAITIKSKTNVTKVWLVSSFSDGGLCLCCRSCSNSSAVLYRQRPWLQHRQ